MTRQFLLFFCILMLSVTCFSQKLVTYEKVGENSLANINAAYGLPIFRNGVEFYKMTYETPDVHGILDTASGLLIVPNESDNAFPMLCYQHGTIGWKSDVPSNLRGGYELAEAWAALGYVVAAPDLLGLGTSRGFHPFVHAETEASAAIDMMRAAKDVFPEINRQINEQLFITGYSQGGHSAAAVHRQIQENLSNEFTVTASAPMSGPYSISGVMNDFMFERQPYFFVGYLPYTFLSYQNAYGNLFNELEDLFKPEYAALIRPFWEGTKDLGDLNNELIDKLTEDFGASITLGMMQDSVVAGVENNPNHPINVASRKNDVYDWTPDAPTRFYYCTADDQITYKNALFVDSIMNAAGAPDVASIDASPNADHKIRRSVFCFSDSVFRFDFY